jgi:hypothetical protein
VPGAQRLALELLAGEYAICRLAPDAAVPDWAAGEGFWSVTRTRDELSVVTRGERVPPGLVATRGWRLLGVRGPLDFDAVGILAGLTGTFAAAGVSIVAISTYDTDWVLVRRERLEEAVRALRAAGHMVADATVAGRA